MFRQSEEHQDECRFFHGVSWNIFLRSLSPFDAQFYDKHAMINVNNTLKVISSHSTFQPVIKATVIWVKSSSLELASSYRLSSESCYLNWVKVSSSLSVIVIVIIVLN
ncbi:hypothetical protein F4703DRAFT_1796968 [Phycomyces blakesleeanus]|uniref:Uncharacterized protein n=1 Tax=Phycomyces blakesleeanus (strain ATCC 8743b / DSM 1359 / FGSC 10004 / NBRC 33097 / NRRL 1555) TaxID=763407 RepID=A0A162ZX42_PHYB8|nr:hypothetical protein PHYBLDRAFT_172218 [Phycomyces blakesleeanus NRRL 1555(-)]OAD69581.1 hypothetical protein PHYBLDRAFT_172218 [Phycomyces blakesleeanus NRRL 1555(-)]|eukprot:XP_018287621.1 hypothetical protein PHYBLDRAFT_172218 [Phycomyces blakesleeanus NRRL 1555(-)]